MIAPELLEQLQQLNPDDRIQVFRILEEQIAKDKEQSERFERIARKIFRERKRVFEELAKGEE